jgi:hypothetical protein
MVFFFDILSRMNAARTVFSWVGGFDVKKNLSCSCEVLNCLCDMNLINSTLNIEYERKTNINSRESPPFYWC